MQTYNDVNRQFAEFFPARSLKPYIYLLARNLADGHICFNLDELENEKETLPEEYKKILNEKAIDFLSEPLVGFDKSYNKPFILHLNKFYLQRYFFYETSILNKILSFGTDQSNSLKTRISSLYSQKELINTLFNSAPRISNDPDLETANHDEKTDWQLVATLISVLNNFTIITGGPGTGKTTTVAKVLAVLFSINPDLKVTLAAPTGKAAIRMTESLQKSKLDVAEEVKKKINSIIPLTIHSLLSPFIGSPYFRKRNDNPLDFDVIIVDEASMIDVALFAKLLDAVKTETRLILLGDKNQLSSVEAGSLLADLCKTQEIMNEISTSKALIINGFIENTFGKIQSNRINENLINPLSEHIIELQYSHRFSGQKGIGRFSKAVITNDKQVLNEFLDTKNDEEVSFSAFEDNFLLESFSRNYELFIKEPDIKQALNIFNKYRVLCAVRDGDYGLYNINKQIESILNDKNLIKINGEFYENRPLMIMRNNLSLGLFNGDVGIIRRDESGQARFYFDDPKNGLRSITPGLIGDAETVFAMTIHKSQGSEYDEILVVLPDQRESKILTRELLYTAITRARKKVYILGSKESILMASERKVRRASGITERFNLASENSYNDLTL